MSNLRIFSIHPIFRRPSASSSSSSSDDESAAGRAGGGRHPANPNRVKRALFGPTDHEENLRFVQREMKRHKEEANARWNFDFDADRPLKGRFEWESAADTAGTSATTTPVGGGAVVVAAAGGASSSESAAGSTHHHHHPHHHRHLTHLSSRRHDGPVSRESRILGGSTSTTTTSTICPSLEALAGPVQGSEADLRTPPAAAVNSSTGTPSPPATSAAVAGTVDSSCRVSPGASENRLAERTAVQSLPSGSLRLSDERDQSSSSGLQQQLGAKSKTKDQKITEVFRSRKASRSKSASKLHRLKRLDGTANPLLLPASRSPSVKSRGLQASAVARRDSPARRDPPPASDY